MQRFLTVAGLCGVLFIGALAAGAGEKSLRSGPQVGDAVNAFDVTKVAGPTDGVKTGTTLCYRCKYGDRPVVMIFSRKTDEKALVELTQKLDEVVAQNEKKNLKCFVTFFGEDAGKLTAKVADFAKTSAVKNIPLTVAAEQPDGPESYSLSADAAYTILVNKEGNVLANHALKAGELSKEKIAAIVKDTSKILN